MGSSLCWERTFTLGGRCIGSQDTDATRQVRESQVKLSTYTHTQTHKHKHKRYMCSAVVCPRWSEVSRRIELCVSILELNEQGEYSSVELHPGKDISTGGIFQLRQVRETLTLAWLCYIKQSDSYPLPVIMKQSCAKRSVIPVRHQWKQQIDVELWVFVHTGSLQEAAGVCESSPKLRHAASAGGGFAVRVYRLCVCSLHQTTETPGQLPGQWHTHTYLHTCTHSVFWNNVCV